MGGTKPEPAIEDHRSRGGAPGIIGAMVRGGLISAAVLVVGVVLLFVLEAWSGYEHRHLENPTVLVQECRELREDQSHGLDSDKKWPASIRALHPLNIDRDGPGETYIWMYGGAPTYDNS